MPPMPPNNRDCLQCRGGIEIWERDRYLTKGRVEFLDWLEISPVESKERLSTLVETEKDDLAFGR